MRGWILAATVSLLVLSSLIGYNILKSYDPPPSIQGAYLQPARKIEHFRLVDHYGNRFDRAHLKGRWHLISYGYTHCPDICPMTLARLAQWKKQLELEELYPDIRVLFYSVDGDRDRPEILAEYVPYFHPEFVGLTRSERSRRAHRNFEQSLGIVASIREGGEWVDHGVMLLLVNPLAQLQAILKPERNAHGLLEFSEEQLFQDYQAIRAYHARRSQ